MNTTAPHWNVRQMIDDLGGCAAVCHAARKHGLPVPEYGTVRQWNSRDAAGSDGLALLAKLIALETNLELADYVTGWPKGEPVVPPPFEGL